MREKFRINHQIKAPELRVIGDQGENFGVLPLSEALNKAIELGLDLIEISPNVAPPVAKITDYGKFQYEQNKKDKESKSRTKTAEIKSIQITIGTGEHDLNLKAKKASAWLREGNRIKIDLFLRGRAKYMDKGFLNGRIERLLVLITEKYKVTEPIRPSPKGLSALIEKA